MTITIRLPDKLEAELRARIDTDKVELSEFVRQAITEKLEREPSPSHSEVYASWRRHFTGWRSGENDRAERAEEILQAEFDADNRR